MVGFEITKQEWFDASTKIAKIEEKTNHIYKAVVGNGQPGLCSRMDRLESSRKTLIWMMGILWTSITTIIVMLSKLLLN